MIVSEKSKGFDYLFGLYNEQYLLKRHFNWIGLKGAVDPPQEGRAVLYIMNHCSWWDGLMLYQAFRRVSERDHYVMMDEKQMSRYRFFRKMGAFSIDKTTPRGIAESLRYAESLLHSGKSVWMFPQGDIYHLEHRPLQFQGGIAYLLDRCPGAILQPVTVYYSMTSQQKPQATLWFGQPLSSSWKEMGRDACTQMLQAALESQLERHRELVIAAPEGYPAGFEPLIAAGRSTSDVFDGIKRRLARWTSFFGR